MVVRKELKEDSWTLSTLTESHPGSLRQLNPLNGKM